MNSDPLTCQGADLHVNKIQYVTADVRRLTQMKPW